MMLEKMEAAAVEEQYLREMFAQIDVNKDGKVSAKEIAVAMGIGKSEAKDLVKEADVNGDGEINFEGESMYCL